MTHTPQRLAALLTLLLALPCAAAAQIDLILEQPQPTGWIEPTPGPDTTVPPDRDAGAWPVEAVAAPLALDGTVPMYAHPNARSAVLMEYYSGARLTALCPVGDGFWKVQAGVKGASVMGYMLAGNLRFGKKAQREVQPAYMELRFNREATVYSYCDTGATPIGVCDTEHTYYAMSRTDEKWVQLFLPPVDHVREQEDRVTAGFVYMETGLGRGYWHELTRWTVDPLPGELTHEAVKLRAVEAAMTNWTSEDPSSFWERAMASSPSFTSSDGLMKMNCRVVQKYETADGGSGTLPDWFYVYFWIDEHSGTLVYRTTPDWDAEDRWESVDFYNSEWEESVFTGYVFEL